MVAMVAMFPTTYFQYIGISQSRRVGNIPSITTITTGFPKFWKEF